MTNSEFDAWVTQHFPEGDSACGRALDIDRETVKALRTGKTKNGALYPVRTHMALACAAWTMGLRKYSGETVAIGEALNKLAEARPALVAALAAIDGAQKQKRPPSRRTAA